MNSEDGREFHYIQRKRGESAAEYKLRKYATISRYRRQEGPLIEVPPQRSPHRSIGFWESRLMQYVGGCEPKFIDNRWTGEYTIECLWCGHSFETKDPRRRYCPGTSCKRDMFISQRKSKDLRPKEQRCRNCGGIMEKRRGARFCCNLCAVTYHRKVKKNSTSHD